MAPDRNLERVTGRASLATVRRGTASEHTGVVLDTPEGDRLILIRLGSNPFEIEESRNLVGREVEVEGYRVGSELRYTAIHELT
jgi:hypothetical protein